MKKLIYLSILLFVAASCSISAHYIQDGAQKYEKTNSENIKLYTLSPEADYIVIGSIAVDVMGDGNDAKSFLKKEAAKIGADAVINITLTKISSPAQRTGISGIAVKLK